MTAKVYVCIFGKNPEGFRTGFVQVMEEFHFIGLKSHGIYLWVMENRGKF